MLGMFSPKIKSSPLKSRGDGVKMIRVVHRDSHEIVRDVGWFAVKRERLSEVVVVTSSKVTSNKNEFEG